MSRPKVISLFNNKGGVGKTTFLYHLAYRLAAKGKTVLMVDCDSQCNLTAYSLQDAAIAKSWEDKGNSIYRAIEQVVRTIGDIRDRAPSKIEDSLFIIPGDLLLSDFEDLLGDTWNAAKGGSESALRPQSAIYRVIRASADKIKADIVLVDLGPNLGALNRAVLGGSDYIIVPISGSVNLGNKLVRWRKEWDQCNGSWGGPIEIPQGQPKFLGYVTQHHNIRNNAAGMTQGWQIFGNRVRSAIKDNIIDKLNPLQQVYAAPHHNFDLGMIPNLHSLIPYSLEARKPVFNCGSQDGLKGAHIQSARDSKALFDPIADLVAAL
jgi:hypothetical protein